MKNGELLDFFHNLDRRKFVDEEYKAYAEVDKPLPIGKGQTISQPSLVCKMTELLNPEKDSKVLEIGTGSGYQTAFLAHFAEEVYTVEIHKELSDKAQKRLNELGYSNINYKLGDGSSGWKEQAPFDRIIVTAAAGKEPKNLVDQLANGGRMIVPIGPPHHQVLTVISKDDKGQISREEILGVRFVEMKGEYGWQ